MQAVRFSAFSLTFPKGKTQITRDNKNQQSVVFTDWSLARCIVPPDKAHLLDAAGKVVATYPVRQENKPGGRINYVIDELDAVGSQG